MFHPSHICERQLAPVSNLWAINLNPPPPHQATSKQNQACLKLQKPNPLLNPCSRPSPPLLSSGTAMYQAPVWHFPSGSRYPPPPPPPHLCSPSTPRSSASQGSDEIGTHFKELQSLMRHEAILVSIHFVIHGCLWAWRARGGAEGVVGLLLPSVSGGTEALEV